MYSHLPLQGRCFACGGDLTHDVLEVPGRSDSSTVLLHPTCVLPFTVAILERLQTYQSEATAEASQVLMDLSPRELQVLEGIARGEKDREIAERLGITQHTVKNHAYDVRQKIGARTRTDAAVLALKAGLLVENRPASRQGEEANVYGTNGNGSS